MEAKSSLIACIALAFFLCATTVKSGNVEVRLSENDYRSSEAEGMLNVAIVVSDGSAQEFGDLVFNVTALTKQQFSEFGSLLCNNGLTLQTSSSTRSAEEADLESMSVTCTRHLLTPIEEIHCSFIITQDTILESDEVFALVLKVEDDAGNSIILGANCAAATISTGTNKGILEVMDEVRKVIEGDLTIHYITIRKNFTGDFPIVLDIHTGGFGEFNGPKDGQDYIFNGGITNGIVFPADVNALELQLEILDDSTIEADESVTVTFNGAVNVPGLDIIIMPPSVTVMIRDNDVVTGGFQDTRDTITITEGGRINVCVELKGFKQSELERGFEIGIEAPPSRDYFLNPPRGRTLTAYLEIESPHCVDIFILSNKAPHLFKSFQVTLVDQGLALIADEAERERHKQLNIIEPHTLTIVIEDDDGTPNRPTITKLDVVEKDNLAFEWSTREEDGLRPVNCYFGNITIRSRQQMSGSGSGDDESTGLLYTFDLCNTSSPKDLQHRFSGNIDDTKQYVVVVCARNQLGVNCSDPRVYQTEIPPTIPTLVGTPKRPTITELYVVEKDNLAFEWSTREEDGLHPVNCYFGNITIRSLQQMSGSGSGDDESTGLLYTFDLCNTSSPKDLQHRFSGNIDDTKQYVVVVCARNQLGVNCSDPRVYQTEIPPTTPTLVGAPNRPTITELYVVEKDNLAFEWSTREEDGLHPVNCYFGNITIRSRQQMSGSDSSDDESAGLLYTFDLCNTSSPKDLQHRFSGNIDETKQYIVVVCARNQLGVNCSDPRVYQTEIPPTTPTLVGAPNRPTITELYVVEKDNLAFEWSTKEEDGLHPVNCYFGNITIRSRQHMSGSDSGDDESTGLLYIFDLCNTSSPKDLQHRFSGNIDDTKQYIVVVCARNQLDVNCSDPRVYQTEIPPTTPTLVGAPNRPTITELYVVEKDNLAFEWSTREEDGLHPVNCYFGNITIRSRQQMSGSDSSDDESAGLLYTFDLCNTSSPKDLQHRFSGNIDDTKQYVVVVCARNQLDVNCSDPRVYQTEIPPTTPTLVGAPNRPTITELEVVEKDNLTFEWSTREEDGLHPVNCYFGNITIRSRQQMSGSDSSDDESAGLLYTFDLCNTSSPKDLQHRFSGNIDDTKQYVVVVCARNQLGVNCSKPMVYQTEHLPTAPILRVGPGVIIGVIVAPVLILCCCLTLLLLIIIFCCAWSREKRYFPQRREKKFAKEATYRHGSHDSLSEDEEEFDFEKSPL